jgi:acyl carrier protein
VLSGAVRERVQARGAAREQYKAASGRRRVSEERMDIAEKVKEIISQQLDVDLAEVKEAASFIDDLGADSLAIVELVLAFEEQFEIDIPDEDTEKIRTVGDAISYIQEHKGK